MDVIRRAPLTQPQYSLTLTHFTFISTSSSRISKLTDTLPQLRLGLISSQSPSVPAGQDRLLIRLWRHPAAGSHRSLRSLVLQKLAQLKMDYPSLHSDLHTLKQRVLELSSKYPQDFHEMAPPSSSAAPDQFSIQFDDILNRLCSVENSMQQYRRMSHDRANTDSVVDPSKMVANPSIIHRAADNASTTSSSSIQAVTNLMAILPLPEIVTKLASDLNSQQNTFRDLESRLNELDNRMDDLDPNRFTPASSTAGSTVENFNPHPYQPRMSTTTSLQPPPLPTPIWELCSEDSPNPFTMPAATQPTSAMRATLPSHLPLMTNSPLNAAFTGQHMQPPPPPHDLHAKTDDLYEQSATMKGQIKELAESNHWLHLHLRNLSASLIAEAGEYESRDASVSSGGVDFRDREITRLDEQLTLAHEKLKASEESATRRESLFMDRGQRIRQLEEMLQEHEAQAAEHRTRMERKLVQAEKHLSAKALQVQDLQAQVMERDDAINRWDDSWRRMSAECRQWHAKLRATEQNCHIIENDKKQQIAKLSAEHEEQTRQLKAFCEQKDTVIQKQQDNISWAGQLLAQRDGEIEHMQRRLRSVEDDHQHTLRTCDRQNRLLNERNQEIDWLKRDPNVRQGTIHKSPVVSRASSPVSTKEAAGSATLDTQPSDSGHALQIATHQMSPWVQPRAHNPQSNDESDNNRWSGSYPFVWDDRVKGFVRQEPPSQAPTSPALPTVGERRRRGRNGDRHRRPSYRQYPELDRPAPSNVSQTSNGATYGSVSQDRRDARSVGFRSSVDDVMPSTPLPAPVTARSSRVAFEDSREEGWPRHDSERVKGGSARRMVSENDLRAQHPGFVAQRRNKHLSERRSMVDLPPRRLHAYVEDGRDSSGEGGGGEV